MSKAFTRESDDESEDAPSLPPPLLPPGVKNYITPGGAQRIREELADLSEKRRQLISSTIPAAPVESTRPSPGQRKMESRIRQLQQVFDSIVVTEPPVTGRDVVRFGASVTVRSPDSEESIYRIVGVDETDFDRGQISWLSPLDRQLLGCRAGDRVRFKTPAGEEYLQITAISYQ